VIDGHAWGHLATGYGALFLTEVLGFVLLPSLLFAYGARNGKVRLVQFAGLLGVLGIAFNRLNVSVFAYNWQLPSEQRYVPHWMEIWVSVTLVTIGVLAFRWIVNRMPILHGTRGADPGAALPAAIT
jgi:Ni/Fe-hydrogenase subunit HybB-like protein